MFNWKNIGLLVAAIFTSQISFAQFNILNAKEVEEIGQKSEAQIESDNDKPLPYGYVDDRDMLWSVEVWEIIDLNERMNFPLLFPTDTMDVDKYRRSLYDVLVKNMKNGKLKDTYADSYFTEKRTYDQLSSALSKIDTLSAGYDQLNAGEAIDPVNIAKRDLTAGDIVQYRIRGIWYFDKRQGELKYRLLGIAPVAPDVHYVDSEDAQNRLVELFWVFYPKAREILHEAKTFNRKNNARPMSFDHLLNARLFSAVVYKEANVYGDRKIRDYLPDNSLFQLLESDKIKESVRNKEQDMWAN
ncbi:type IX secretion system ring protein PorN/GldN [Capnocytophaga felis]|uniref:Gliding motility protein GldO n=1 Tax=Capnocytophaga felis TaxID=2267611 RepID=A0A5M4B813_9FLAO|nr:gliding motility protein GldN [Capnocytophaga felis]GET45510.1 gliding motility protein GldO [Capnocytophaga felis]GET47327.1 gliding motility protein GldO [Capnocytophaga felis]